MAEQQLWVRGMVKVETAVPGVWSYWIECVDTAENLRALQTSWTPTIHDEFARPGEAGAWPATEGEWRAA